MTGSKVLASETRVALVSRHRIVENYRSLVERSDVGAIADLPADAFGHGLVPAARTVLDAGARAIGVTRLADALRLRQAGITSDIILWASAPSDDLSAVREHAIALGVSSREGLERAIAASVPALWLVVGERPGAETFTADELDDALRRIGALGTTPTTLGLSLAGGGVGLLIETLGRAVSAGIAITAVAAPLASLDPDVPRDLADAPPFLVRLGAELFGLSDSTAVATAATRPALSLLAPVIAVKRVAADVGISYGYTYRTTHDTRVALVPVGYGDGIDRSAGNAAQVMLGGTRYTIAGRVAMDASVLDIGSADVGVGDVVEFFGDPESGAPSAQDWAAVLGVSSAAIVAGLTARVERRWT